MILQSIRSTQSALQAIIRRQSVSSNNVANSQTPGFKSSRAEQQTTIGGGTSIGSITSNRAQGGFRSTSRSLDLAISGRGFFQVETPGGPQFTRAGNFQTDADGNLVTTDGFQLADNINVPPEATGINVSPDGTVSVRTPEGNTEQVGQIELTRFPNPEGLRKSGDNLLQPAPASGQPITGMPGTNGRGSIQSGFLERAQVDLVREVTNQIINENDFSLNIEVLKTKDRMLGEVIDLKS